MTILCTGSVAVDHIMVTPGRFEDAILPDSLHTLNVSFYAPKLTRSFGGNAANVAFTLKRLGEDPLVLASVGADDFAAYEDWFARHQLRRDGITKVRGESTAGAYIITDAAGNQINGFHPGAMDRAHESPISGLAAPFAISLISPNNKLAMLQHAAHLQKRAGVFRAVNPGQCLSQFDGAELLQLIRSADLLITNDYEWRLVREKTGLSADEIKAEVGAVIVTRGADGSVLFEGGRRTEVSPVKARRLADPTGCGDAFIAGLLHGVRRGESLPRAARIGSLLGALLAERNGTQSLGDLTPAQLQTQVQQILDDE